MKKFGIKKDLRVRQIGFIVAMLLVFAFALFRHLDLFRQLDYYFQDTLYQQSRDVQTDIVIVAIDDESLDVLGKWPWPRDYHAALLEKLFSANPKAVGVDVLLLEENDDPSEDDLLVETVSKLKKKPVFACYGSLAESSGVGVIEAETFNRPFDRLAPHVNLGHINTLPDIDGMVRHSVLKISSEGETIDSFSSMLYSDAYGKKPEVSLDPWQRMYIRYAGKTGWIERVPYHMVLTGEADPEYFRDKIVLVGVTAVGLPDDYYFTPIDRAYPMYGIEVHANIIQQFQDDLTWREWGSGAEVLILVVFGVLSSFLYAKLRLGYGVLSLLATLVGYLALAIGLSRLQHGYVLSIVYFVLEIVLIFIVHNLVNYIEELLERKRVTDVFSKYMEPKLVERLLQGGEAALGLGGVKRHLTVLFVDIRGFTTMSENLEPEQVVNILNEYLNLCAEAIFKYEGTLDKYIGDATMALFGAPLEIEDHAFKAVQTAYYMQRGSQRLSVTLMEKYGRTVSFGVGVNTGHAIVGNIGASHRLDYTAIGDAVNTAARLESNAKPGQVLLSAATYELVKDRVIANSLGPLSVKGKQQTVDVYELVGIKGSENKEI